jgi:PAS domain S-box-containing protein
MAIVGVRDGQGLPTAEFLLEAMSDAFYALGPDWRLTYVNAAAERLAGAPRDKLIGRDPRELFPHSVGSALWDRHREVMEGRRPQRFHVRSLVIGRQVEGSINPGDDGGVFVIVRDVEEEATAERALSAREAQLELVLESVSDAFYALDADFRFVLFNRACERFLATPRERVLGRTIWEAFPTVAGTELEGHLRSVAGGGGPIVFEYESRHVPGRMLEMRAGPIEGGGVAVTFIDITDRKAAEAARAASEERLRDITDAMPVLISYVDRDEVFRFVNKAYEERFKRPLSEIVGRSLREVMGPEVYEARRRYVEQALAGERVTYEAPFGALSTQIEHIPHRNAAGEVLGFYSQVQDLTEEKRIQAALHASEQRLRTVMDILPGFVWFAEPDGAINHLNDRWYEYTGQTPEEALPTGWTETVHPEDAARTAEIWAHALSVGCPYEVELRYRRRDGAYRWYVARAERMVDDRGAVLGWAGFSADIHDRKTAEERLAESQERLRALADNLPLAMVYQIVLEADGSRRFSYVGAASQALLGLAPDAAMADPGLLYSRILPEHRERFAQAEAEAIENLAPFDEEAAMRVANGDVRWFRILSAPRRTAGGALVFDGLLMDVTEARATRQAIAASEERLRLALEGAQLGEWEWNEAEGLIRLSERAAAIYGVGQQTISWAELQSHIHPDEQAPIVSEARRALEANDTYNVEYRYRRPGDAHEVWLSVHGRVHTERQGARRMIGVVADTTERRNVEERERLLGREIDHRARNALAVVQSLVRLTPFNDRSSFVETVCGRVNAMARVHTLLSRSRWAGASIREIVEQELAPYAKDQVRVAGPDVHMRLESAQPFSMIVHELATNSVKHGALAGAAGELEVRWRSDAAGLTFEWLERGGGPARPPERSGFGSRLIEGAVSQLGAAISRSWDEDGLKVRIVVANGQLRPETLPAAKEPVRKTAALGVRNARVLLVEDETLLAMEVAEVLKAAGAAVLGPANTLEQALALAATETIDAAVLDVNLGGASARPVARLLQTRGVPFVLVTGYEEPGIEEAGPVLRKPVSHDDLLRALGDLTAR